MDDRPPKFRSCHAKTKAWVDCATYTDEEKEFLLAMDRYKRDNRRPYPTWSEVLEVLKSLGYTKQHSAM
jgi:hypothetical protein